VRVSCCRALRKIQKTGAAGCAAIESAVGSVDGIMVMGKHETGFARVARDHYPTREAWVTEALLDHLDVAGLKIWEMAAGAGDMAKVLKGAGAWVFCSDIADYGFPLDALFDFTSADMPPLLDFDAMITNPPAGLRNHLAVKFIEVGLTRIPRGGFLALLLPVDFDSGVTRRPFFCDCPYFTGKIVLTRRIVWFERTDGEREAPKENYAWFVWSRPVLRHRPPPITLYGPRSPNFNGSDEHA
jgi:hypothetical protein